MEDSHFALHASNTGTNAHAYSVNDLTNIDPSQQDFSSHDPDDIARPVTIHDQLEVDSTVPDTTSGTHDFEEHVHSAVDSILLTSDGSEKVISPDGNVRNHNKRHTQNIDRAPSGNGPLNTETDAGRRSVAETGTESGTAFSASEPWSWMSGQQPMSRMLSHRASPLAYTGLHGTCRRVVLQHLSVLHVAPQHLRPHFIALISLMSWYRKKAYVNSSRLISHY